MGSESTTLPDDSSGTTSGSGSDSGSESSSGDETTGGVVEPPDVQDHGGGEPRVITFADAYAYVAQGPRVYVWNIAEPDAPWLAGSTAPFDGLVSGIAMHGSHMIVSVDRDLSGEVHVLDATDPAAPTLLAEIDWTAGVYAKPTDVIVVGDTLYLSDTENGVFSLDVTDPESPVAIDSYEIYGVNDLHVDGDTLRALSIGFIGGATVTTFTVDAGDFTYQGELSLGDGTDLAYDGTTAYRSGFFGFSAWDITDPSAPVSIYEQPDQLGWAVVAGSDAAYLMADDGVHVYDATGGAVVPASTVDASVIRTLVAEHEGANMLAATAFGLGLVFDVGTDPLAPVQLAMFDLPVATGPGGIAFRDDLLFIADFHTGLRICSANDWGPVGRFTPSETAGVEDVAVVGDIAYLADWSSGLWIVDVTDPKSPQLRSHVATGGYPSAVEIVGDYALVGESTGAGAVVVVDVADPDAPAIVATAPTTKVRDMALAGDLLLVADEAVFGPGGLRIFDVSDPPNLSEVGYYGTCNSSIGVARRGQYALLSCVDELLHVVDISDPDSPTQAATLDLGISGSWGIGAFGDHAYLGHGLGVLQIDISDPTNPSILQDVPVAQPVRRFAARDDGAVYGAAGQAGIYRMQ